MNRGVSCVCYCWISTIHNIKISSKPYRKILWFLNTLPNGVTHLIMPLIDDKDIKPCWTSQTSNTPPSRRSSNHKHGQICNKLRVKVQVTSDQWPHNSLIIKRNAVTRSLEKFFNLELTSVNVYIRGKK